MATQRFEPVHRTILAFDIEGFGGPQRSNPVRSMMRMGLYGLIREALVHSIGSLAPCKLSDLGDGVLVLIDAEVPKNRIVEPFMSDMAMGLKRYNEQTGANAEIRLRAGLHAGEIIEDPQGYSGQDLNLAFRLMDCAALRTALSRTRANLGLIVSDHFYDTIVKQGFEGIDPSAYSQVEVKVKETVTNAWLYLPVPRSEADLPPRESAAPLAGSTRAGRSMPVQKPTDLRDLPPTCLYVSTGNVHNQRLYGLHHREVPLSNHLETALLLGRHAVLHCLDPYRSDEVSRLVSEFDEFVRDGSLLFLLGQRVKNPRRDYAAYLEYRVREYGRSPYGGPDVASFQLPDPEHAIQRTIAFLEASPFALHRGYSSTTALTRAVKADLDVDERIVICEHYGSSRIHDLSLTLRQILQLTRIHPDGTQQPLLADGRAIDHLQDRIADLVAHESFSKQILLGLIADELKIDEQHPFYEVIAARIGVVHLLATIGNLSFLEITNSRDRLSPYYYGHLLDHLGVLVDCPPKRTLGVELVDELRSLQWWRFFANYHLRLMADLQARQSSGDPDSDPLVMFEGSRLITQFDDIRAVIRNAWNA
jgi:class 3 adenylate cyclase